MNTMDGTIRALTDLASVDEKLSTKEHLIGGLALALQGRRAALRNVIPGIFLATYDALGRAGRRPILVAVRDAHCGGCNLRLPPQLDSSIRQHLAIAHCPHCHRLLYSFSRAENGEASKGSRQETKESASPNGAGISRGRRLWRDEDAHDARSPRRASRRRGVVGIAGTARKAKPVER